jgi:RNA 3'-terminal phosphate cyclase (ATP)
MTPIYVDGAQGEGGGQIVRSSLALSLVTGRPVTIENIRAHREKPGLRQQHLTAVNAAAAISGGTLHGAQIGSQCLQFEPQTVRAGTYRFDVGTAGSATLVLQTILPALMTADGGSTVVLGGGTHNPWAPPFDFVQRVFLPLVGRMGPRVSAAIERHGFYPAGGGRITATIEPHSALSGFDLLERGNIISSSAQAIVANLPLHIVQRELRSILKATGWEAECGRAEQVDALGPGNVAWIEVCSEHVTEIFTAFGRIGVPAERVAREVVEQANAYLNSSAAVGHYLADQLLLPLGISAWQSNGTGRQRGGSFRTLPLTQHTTTHIEVLRQFLGIDIRVEDAEDGTSLVRVSPGQHE